MCPPRRFCQETRSQVGSQGSRFLSHSDLILSYCGRCHILPSVQPHHGKEVTKFTPEIPSSVAQATNNVEDFRHSTHLLGATTLRNVLGTKYLAEILSER